MIQRETWGKFQLLFEGRACTESGEIPSEITWIPEVIVKSEPAMAQHESVYAGQPAIAYPTVVYDGTKVHLGLSEWVCSFLTAHQHKKAI